MYTDYLTTFDEIVDNAQTTVTDLVTTEVERRLSDDA